MIPGVDKSYVKSQIDQARDVLGRIVDVHTPRRDACSICLPSGYYDSRTDTSFYTQCPVCKGTYYLNTTDVTGVLARVHWVQDEAITATPGGKYYLGDAQITVDIKYRTLFEAAQPNGKVVVDGHDMGIVKISPMGAPEINRYRIILKGTGDRPKD